MFQPPIIHYDMVFGENLLNQAVSFAKSLSLKPILITTTAIQQFLPQYHGDTIVLPQGESIKTRAMKEKIEDALIERGVGRECCLIVVGGGALLDLVGFISATYCRGIPYVSMPSTLIAMTDAAIGGKTGINVEEAKNWIGAFHHPAQILIDFTLLRTLPEREYVCGFAESIKHSLIIDAPFFHFIEKRYEELLAREPAYLQEMIERSCLIKKGIVEQDPYEKGGLRRILNFGHTVGHALETLSHYQLPHGQAVMMGMQVEAAVSKRLGHLSSSDYESISHFFEAFPIQMDFPERLPYEMMLRDKKGAHRFVALNTVGSVVPFEGEYVTLMSQEAFKAGWNDVVCHA